jgi:hypothetical protein
MVGGGLLRLLRLLPGGEMGSGNGNDLGEDGTGTG